MSTPKYKEINPTVWFEKVFQYEAKLGKLQAANDFLRLKLRLKISDENEKLWELEDVIKKLETKLKKYDAGAVERSYFTESSGSAAFETPKVMELSNSLTNLRSGFKKREKDLIKQLDQHKQAILLLNASYTNLKNTFKEICGNLCVQLEGFETYSEKQQQQEIDFNQLQNVVFEMKNQITAAAEELSNSKEPQVKDTRNKSKDTENLLKDTEMNSIMIQTSIELTQQSTQTELFEDSYRDIIENLLRNMINKIEERSHEQSTEQSLEKAKTAAKLEARRKVSELSLVIDDDDENEEVKSESSSDEEDYNGIQLKSSSSFSSASSFFMSPVVSMSPSKMGRKSLGDLGIFPEASSENNASTDDFEHQSVSSGDVDDLSTVSGDSKLSGVKEESEEDSESDEDKKTQKQKDKDQAKKSPEPTQEGSKPSSFARKGSMTRFGSFRRISSKLKIETKSGSFSFKDEDIQKSEANNNEDPRGTLLRKKSSRRLLPTLRRVNSKSMSPRAASIRARASAPVMNVQLKETTINQLQRLDTENTMVKRKSFSNKGFLKEVEQYKIQLKETKAALAEREQKHNMEVQDLMKKLTCTQEMFENLRKESMLRLPIPSGSRSTDSSVPHRRKSKMGVAAIERDQLVDNDSWMEVSSPEGSLHVSADSQDDFAGQDIGDEDDLDDLDENDLELINQSMTPVSSNKRVFWDGEITTGKKASVKSMRIPPKPKSRTASMLSLSPERPRCREMGVNTDPVQVTSVVSGAVSVIAETGDLSTEAASTGKLTTLLEDLERSVSIFPQLEGEEPEEEEGEMETTSKVEFLKRITEESNIHTNSEDKKENDSKRDELRLLVVDSNCSPIMWDDSSIKLNDVSTDPFPVETLDARTSPVQWVVIPPPEPVDRATSPLPEVVKEDAMTSPVFATLDTSVTAIAEDYASPITRNTHMPHLTAALSFISLSAAYSGPTLDMDSSAESSVVSPLNLSVDAATSPFPTDTATPAFKEFLSRSSSSRALLKQPGLMVGGSEYSLLSESHEGAEGSAGGLRHRLMSKGLESFRSRVDEVIHEGPEESSAESSEFSSDEEVEVVVEVEDALRNRPQPTTGQKPKPELESRNLKTDNLQSGMSSPSKTVETSPTSEFKEPEVITTAVGVMTSSVGIQTSSTLKPHKTQYTETDKPSSCSISTQTKEAPKPGIHDTLQRVKPIVTFSTISTQTPQQRNQQPISRIIEVSTPVAPVVSLFSFGTQTVKTITEPTVRSVSTQDKLQDRTEMSSTSTQTIEIRQYQATPKVEMYHTDDQLDIKDFPGEIKVPPLSPIPIPLEYPSIFSTSKQGYPPLIQGEEPRDTLLQLLNLDGDSAPSTPHHNRSITKQVTVSRPYPKTFHIPPGETTVKLSSLVGGSPSLFDVEKLEKDFMKAMSYTSHRHGVQEGPTSADVDDLALADSLMDIQLQLGRDLFELERKPDEKMTGSPMKLLLKSQEEAAQQEFIVKEEQLQAMREQLKALEKQGNETTWLKTHRIQELEEGQQRMRETVRSLYEECRALTKEREVSNQMVGRLLREKDELERVLSGIKSPETSFIDSPVPEMRAKKPRKDEKDGVIGAKGIETANQLLDDLLRFEDNFGYERDEDDMMFNSSDQFNESGQLQGTCTQETKQSVSPIPVLVKIPSDNSIDQGFRNFMEREINSAQGALNAELWNSDIPVRALKQESIDELDIQDENGEEKEETKEVSGLKEENNGFLDSMDSVDFEVSPVKDNEIKDLRREILVLRRKEAETDYNYRTVAQERDELRNQLLGLFEDDVRKEKKMSGLDPDTYPSHSSLNFGENPDSPSKTLSIVMNFIQSNTELQNQLTLMGKHNEQLVEEMKKKEEKMEIQQYEILELQRKNYQLSQALHSSTQDFEIAQEDFNLLQGQLMDLTKKYREVVQENLFYSKKTFSSPYKNRAHYHA